VEFFFNSFAGSFSLLGGVSIWLFMILGCLWGVFVGAMPGIGTTLGYALLIPLTFTLDPVTAVAMLLAMSVGSQFGNSLPAILLAVPGSAATVMTAIDGHALYKQGKGDIALGASYIAALAGQLISIPLFVALVIPLAELAYVFQPPEMFGMYVLGMVAVVSIAGNNVLKGLLSAGFGLLLGIVGRDPLTSLPRFVFDIDSIRAGLDETALVVGLLALGELFRSLRQKYDWSADAKPKRIKLPRLRAMGGRDLLPSLFGGTLIGTLVGAVPGAGATTSALVSYQQAKLWSKKPEEFGKGSVTGIVANESAQNASNSGELIPTLALGIPSGGSMLILLSALVAQGFVPGPFLIVEDPQLLHAAIAGLIGGTILLIFIGMRMAGWMLRLSRVDRSAVMVGALALVLLGVYSLRASITDVWVTLFAGVIGYFMYRYGFSPAAAALAVILSRGFEASARYGLALSDDSFLKLVTRPVTATLLLLAALLLALGIYREVKVRRRARKPLVTPATSAAEAAGALTAAKHSDADAAVDDDPDAAGSAPLGQKGE
jgi:putative tricarboxylic transport membrane protein